MIRLRSILARSLLPHHIVRSLRRRRIHRRVPTVHGNAQLQLYSRMLPGDFLHYGYFDDPDTPAEEISFAGLYRAQLRYAQILIERIGPPDLPVLDAGSGMGGMLGLLHSAGHGVTGLTPDRVQVDHIRRAYPDIPVLRCRFEHTPVDRFKTYFGTVVHAESVQYMEPEGVFAIVDKILVDSGTWIVADYFRVADADADADARPRARRRAGANRSGWRLDSFRDRVRAHGFEITDEADITDHVLPTLAFARLLADRIALPALDFAHGKLRAKFPGLHYVLEDVAERARDATVRSAEVLDPAVFAAHKRYMLMSLRRT